MDNRKGQSRSDIVVLDIEHDNTAGISSINGSSKKEKPNSNTAAHFIAAGVPKGFILLIFFCFFAAIFAIVGFITYASDSNHSTSDSVLSSPLFLFILGIVNSLVGSLQTASGYCCQRLAHKSENECPTNKPITKHPIYITGLMLLIAGTVAAIMNLGLLGQSVTAPFAALTLIYNAFLARTVLKESITKWDVYSSILVIIGVGIAVFGVTMANIEVQSFVLEEIEALFTRSLIPPVYTVFVICLIVGLQVYVRKNNLQRKRVGMFTYSVCAGLMAGFTSVTVKCTVELIKGTVQRDSGDMTRPMSYVFVAAIPVCLLSQLSCMNSGLKYFGTLKFVPLYHAFIILSNLINGIVYFNEADDYTMNSSLLFTGGCFVTISGVMLLLEKSEPRPMHQMKDAKAPMPSQPPTENEAMQRQLETF